VSLGVGLLASDIPALLGITRSLWALEDDQIAEIGPGTLRVTTLEGEEVEPVALQVDWDLEAAQKAGYDDFMSKEMHEQPRAVADTLLGRLASDGTIFLDEGRIGRKELVQVDKVVIVACGSSYHAGLVAKYAIERWARIPAEIDIASEFRYRDPVLDQKTLVIGVSQSGETVDTLQAMRQAKREGARVLVISNVVDSSMAREADGALYTRAGPEIGVAATKTLLTQIVSLEILALYLAEIRGTLTSQQVGESLEELGRLPEVITSVLARDADVAAVAKQFTTTRDFFYLGRHVGYPVAMEGALKLKELAYVRAEAYPAGELKHGPIALIEPGSVVIGVATRTSLREKMLANISEVKSRGATVVLVANDGDEDTSRHADAVLWTPQMSELLAPVVDIVPLQLFAYHLARLHGHDVDRPRNLAKTVTVE
jgi:glucosamine--fructose-6-phosphate aminotransferase (isomerizing)